MTILEYYHIFTVLFMYGVFMKEHWLIILVQLLIAPVAFPIWLGVNLEHFFDNVKDKKDEIKN